MTSASINYEIQNNLNKYICTKKNINSVLSILNKTISINSCQFSSELIALGTDFASLEQFFVEEDVGVFLSSVERHIKFPVRATKTNK